ncbi:SDR family NAD(P)-dependent oxidoreductase [Nonomuraea sediminis]|uniref:SDR family NAD(P)-dependent oxidoreductase n=1 Tax=Nonomuraea sediminis TaxID=2835864 RepID=UPI001BDCD33B|nr:SDR family NAD(P)-dependent oxidoreductase [Nonomuraea sediminis]
MRTILITGSTQGLGQELAHRLTAAGDRVIVHGRSEIRQADGIRADLADLHAVDAMATWVLDRYDRLDVLINNAGVGGGKPGSGRELSKDGIELRFAVNYLAGFHLTRRLLPLLTASSPARVVNVASVGQQAIDFSDPMLEHGYGRQRAYSQSKLAQIMFTIDLAEELASQDVTVNALHPATYMDTTMVREAGAPVLSTVAEGADATMSLVNGHAGVTGRYFNGHHEARADPQAYAPDARRRLRELSDALIERALGR